MDDIETVVDYALHFLELLKTRETYSKVTRWWSGVEQTCSSELQHSTNTLLKSLDHDNSLWQQLQSSVRNSLSKFHGNQVMIGVIERLLRTQSRCSRLDQDSSLRQLTMVISELNEIWRNIVEAGFYPAEGQLMVAVDLLATIELRDLCKTNLFLNYVLMTQKEFDAKQVFRLLEEVTQEQPRKLSDYKNPALSLINIDEIVPELDDFASHFHSEMLSKFQLYASNNTGGERGSLLSVCDFLTLLRVIFQDRHHITLAVGSQPPKTSVFKSVTGGKTVMKAIFEFFYEKIKLDQSLEENQKHRLKMNYEIFLAIFNYLLRTKVLEWTSSSENPAEEANPKTKADGIPIDTILSLNLHHHIKKVIDSESPLSFKIMEMMTDVKALYYDEMRPAEKQVANDVLKNLSLQLSRLKFFHTNFDSREDHFKLIDKARRKIEKIYFLHTSTSFYAHYNMRNPNIDLDKYLTLLESLGVCKLLPGFTRKNFVVPFMLEANKSGQVDFAVFLTILEGLICQLLERYSDHTFESMLDLLLRNGDKSTFDKKGASADKPDKGDKADKRPSLLNVKEKKLLFERNPYSLKKHKTVIKPHKDSEREESHMVYK